MTNIHLPEARKHNIVVQQLSDEVLVYDLDTNKALCLNETSAAVWRVCNGKNDVSGISSILSKEFNKTVSKDVIEFALDQLAAENLIDGYTQKIDMTSRTSRREAIKKIGLTSVVALPIVAAIVAPKAGSAQSGMAPLLADNSPCTGSAQCASGCCGEIVAMGVFVCKPNDGRCL